jgi:hypothetical protein
MTSPKRMAVLGLVPAATVAGHAAGYLLAGQPVHRSGGAGDLACWPIAALAVAVLLWFGMSPRGSRSIPGVRQLAGAQLTLFVVQELAEGRLHLSAAVGAATWSAIRYGIAGQILVAVLTVVLARLLASGGARLREAWAARTVRHRETTTGWCSLPAGEPPRRVVGGWTSERGPPGALAPS